MSDAELAGRDALAVHHLAEPIVASLDAQGMADLYRTVENPLVWVLAKMEHVGVGVDVGELEALKQATRRRGARRSVVTASGGGRSGREPQPQLAEATPRRSCTTSAA